MKKVLFLLVMIAAFVACSKDDDNSGDNDIVDNEEVSFKIDSIVYDDVRFGVGRVYRIVIHQITGNYCRMNGISMDIILQTMSIIHYFCHPK